MRHHRKPESWNNSFPRQVFSLAARSRFVPMREKEHAPELHSAQKRQVAATRDRNSNGKTLAPCGSRIWPGCFLVPKVCSRSGISMVRVARRLPLLLLQNTGAMSVDSIGHRRLCFEFAFAFPERCDDVSYFLWDHHPRAHCFASSLAHHSSRRTGQFASSLAAADIRGRALAALCARSCDYDDGLDLCVRAWLVVLAVLCDPSPDVAYRRLAARKFDREVARDYGMGVAPGDRRPRGGRNSAQV